MLAFRLRFHAIILVGNGQLLAALGTTGSQYTTAIGSGHSLTETVLVSSLSVRGLECSFHCSYLFYVIIPVSGCKSRDFPRNNQGDNSFSLKSFVFFTELHYFCSRNKETLITNIII